MKKKQIKKSAKKALDLDAALEEVAKKLRPAANAPVLAPTKAQGGPAGCTSVYG